MLRSLVGSEMCIRDSLDGRVVRTGTLGGALPVVAIEPGRHEVRYTYAPTSVRLGAALSLLGLALCVAWLLTEPGRWARLHRVRPPDEVGG